MRLNYHIFPLVVFYYPSMLCFDLLGAQYALIFITVTVLMARLLASMVN